MGFLQRGFAYGNRRGFGVWAVGAAFTFALAIIVKLLGGGGKTSAVVNLLEIPPVLLGHGSYPDSIGLELTVDLFDMLNTTQGGGGKTADQTANMLTTPVVLSLGSYP